jgi:hypothetical protein
MLLTVQNFFCDGADRAFDAGAGLAEVVAMHEGCPVRKPENCSTPVGERGGLSHYSGCNHVSISTVRKLIMANGDERLGDGRGYNAYRGVYLNYPGHRRSDDPADCDRRWSFRA